MIGYQADKTRKIPKDTQETEERERTHRVSVLLPSDAIEEEASVLPSPVSLLASDRRDPFHSFARPFNRIEHFLLDYCKSLSVIERYKAYNYQGILLHLMYQPMGITLYG
jgi:hypothetical protein